MKLLPVNERPQVHHCEHPLLLQEAPVQLPLRAWQKFSIAGLALIKNCEHVLLFEVPTPLSSDSVVVFLHNRNVNFEISIQKTVIIIVVCLPTLKSAFHLLS